jgi:hypothetical protein
LFESEVILKIKEKSQSQQVQSTSKEQSRYIAQQYGTENENETIVK